jgi:hypothetical protein
MSKCVLLNGRQCDIIDYNFREIDIKKYFEVDDFDYIGYHTFGQGYTMWWQNERKEPTSMEITMHAGASYPIFIDSKVLITNEDCEEEKQIDINLEELKKHFNTNNSFWALMKNFI